MEDLRIVDTGTGGGTTLAFCRFLVQLVNENGTKLETLAGFRYRADAEAFLKAF